MPAGTALARFWPCLAMGLVLAGCPGGHRSGASGSAAPPASPVPTPSAKRPSQEPLANERVDVPAGTFLAGSVPGEPGRAPEVEPRSYRVELGPYQIDKLPYPNDPRARPATGLGRDEAARLCHDQGARLCTELEWERACKGPGNDRFAGSASWDARCASEPKSCASGFEVLGMGGALREWTASDVVSTEPDVPRRAAVRGAPGAADATQHRCAARAGIDAETKADDLGFRCCHGAPNAAGVREPKLGETFQKAKLGAERLGRLLASNPRTAALAATVKLFREPDAANTVVERGPGDRKGFLFTVAPLLWNPVAGAEYLLVVGRAGDDTSFVLAYYVVGEDEYDLAASFVMKHEPGPVALAYSPSIRPRVHFSTCWGCPGETGKILLRTPDSVAIVQP